MKILSALIVLILTISTITLAKAPGKGKIVGEVIDYDTKQPIPGVVIEVVNTNIFTQQMQMGILLLKILYLKHTT